MAYFDIDFLYGVMGPGQVSGCLAYGDTPASLTGSVFTSFADSSSGWVDSILAGKYDVPFTTPPPMIKMIAAQHCAKELLIRANKPVPAELNDKVTANEGILLALQEGTINLAGVAESNESAAQGGHSISNNDSDSSENGQKTFFDSRSMFGKWS